MPRLIDSDELIDELEEELEYSFPNMTDTVQSAMKSAFRIAIRRVKKAPTIEAESVRHGKWNFGEIGPIGQSVKCSECGWGCNNVNQIVWMRYLGHKFCGNCGAKMDLK